MKLIMRLPKLYCKELAEYISNDDILFMLKSAKKNINWNTMSRANKGISRKGFWNMFCTDFEPTKQYPPIIKYRLLEEFGEYLPEIYKL